MKASTSFDSFAEVWDRRVRNAGHYTHQHTILPALFALVGNVRGRTVYDVACGNGFLARKLISKGAKEVWASDISPRLIEIATTKYSQNAYATQCVTQPILGEYPCITLMPSL
jgi:ubiquinone/menaquinone biosynthesis C-methylase UbiE